MRLLTLALSLGSAVLSTALVGPASAETRSDRDTRHDVLRYDTDDLGDNGTIVPGKARIDIVSHRFTYGDKRLVAVIRLKDVRRTKRLTWLGVPLQWPEGGGARGYGEMSVLFRRNGPAQGHGSFESGDAACTFRHHVDYETDRVRMVIPAKCLGSPPVLRGYGVIYTVTPDAAFVDTSPDNLDGRGGVRVERG